MSELEKIRILPLLPLKNSVLFPGLLMPLSVGRASSLEAVEVAVATEDKEIIVVAQRDASADTPSAADLFTIGTRAAIRKVARPKGDHIDILAFGLERVVIVKVNEEGGHFSARYHPLPAPDDSSRETEALTLSIVEMGSKFMGLIQSPQASPQELARLFTFQEDPLRLAYTVASLMNLEAVREQALLEATTRVEALRLVHGWLSHEVEVMELRNKITEDARGEMSREQKEYILRQQKKAIEQELGEKNGDQAEVEELREKLAKADLPEDVRKEAERELGRLEKLPPSQPEHNVIRTWLEYVIELPWNKRSEDSLDLAKARQVLDEDHFGITKVKERILEHLAVLKLNPEAKAPILCFVGAPGVGKTSLGQSIARALGRKFERMSLGGLHDEAELRGHRRTYIGALPGRLLQAMRRAGFANPVLMLDEVDKLGRDFRGDPAAALLEILDPEQNKTFRDNYLDVPFDLSKVLFITTANMLDTIPEALRDRMEIIELPGYTGEEKIHIARKYLIPKQAAEHGIKEGEQLEFTEEGLREIIHSFTREAGVRNLEREIATLVRKQARKLAEGKNEKMVVTPEVVREYLGVPKFRTEREVDERVKRPGVAVGLVWTPVGGDIVFIEATRMRGGKHFTMTGHLGEVMQESMTAALTWTRANGERYGIDPDFFRKQDIHIHVPSGGVPKDGPSAGAAMVTALISMLTNRPVKNRLAMTGEMTLSGVVLPIGGVKEKVLGAKRAGITHVLLPADNEPNAVADLPPDILGDMKITYVHNLDEVLEAALEKDPIAPVVPEPEPAQPGADGARAIH